MKELTVLGCTLDSEGLGAQRGRAERLRETVDTVELDGLRLEIRFRESVDDALVRELVAVERGCCPFFSIVYDKARRLLGVTVAEPEREPALAELAAVFR